MVSNATSEARQTASQRPKGINIPRGPLLINGTWGEGKSGEAIPTIDPTTEEVFPDPPSLFPRNKPSIPQHL
jgi:hypothetical protein